MEPVLSQSIVGIDVSKRTLDIATSTSSRQYQLANEPAGFAALLADLPAALGVLIVLEATGEYHLPLVEALDAAGYRCAVCNPAHVRAFARSRGSRSKSDRTDAKLLVDFGVARSPRAHALLPPALRRLRALLVRRDQLIGLRTMERNRLAGAHDESVRESMRRSLVGLQAEIETISHLITTLIADDPALRARSVLLQTVPGIGPIVSAQLMAGLTELGELNAQELAALVGVAPFARDSGQFRGKRFTGGGRATIRQALYQAITSAVSHHCHTNRLQEHFDQLRARQKPHKVAIVAEIRRLLRYLTIMVRENLTWNQLNINQEPEPVPIR